MAGKTIKKRHNKRKLLATAGLLPLTVLLSTGYGQTHPVDEPLGAREPSIRRMPSQPGNCVGVAFFALNYPWRDQWDAGYEHIVDASTMGALVSRHGPVATVVWEEIREAHQTASLAMMVREALGVQRFAEVTDPAMQQLITSGTPEELLTWLETRQERGERLPQS